MGNTLNCNEVPKINKNKKIYNISIHEVIKTKRIK